MAFHRIGNSIYSDDELRQRNDETASLLVPAAVTGIGIYFLYGWLNAISFFITHTSIAKLTYVLSGIFLFALAYVFRKLIVSLVVVAVFFLIFGLGCSLFWQWLVH